MKLYYLFDDLDFGKYAGEILTDVFRKDPAYIDSCLCTMKENFSILFTDLEKLNELNPGFSFSVEAIENAKEAERYLDAEDESGSIPEDPDDDLDE
jgi:hypothetical protein